MKWKIIERLDEITEDELLITEDVVIKKVVKGLKERGIKILKISTSSQRGIDILAEDNLEKIVIECKGTMTLRHGGNIFSSNQNQDHLGRALIQCMERYSKIGDGKYFIAVPVHNDFNKILGKTGPMAKQLPVRILLVGKDAIYEYS